MKRSLILVSVIAIAFLGVYSLTAFFIEPAQAELLVDESVPAGPTAVNAGEPRVELAKSAAYYDAANVAIVNVTGLFIDEYTAWNRYQGGEFDTIPLPADIISDVKISPHAGELYTTTQIGTNYYGFMNDVPPFDNPQVRAAFATALDRQNLINVALGGDEVPALTFTPPGAFGHVDGYAMGVGHPYSPTLAAALLTASGYTGTPTITMMVNNYEPNILMANAARQEWFNTLGVSVTLVVKEWPEYLDLLNNGAANDRPGIFRLGWMADYPDAHNFLSDALSSDRMRYNNPVYDDLVMAAAGETNPSTRNDLYKQAESYLVMTDTAMAPINYYVDYDLTRPTLIRTYQPFGGQHIDQWSFPVPETLELVWGEPFSLDPAFGLDSLADANYIEQLFLGLTDFDAETGAVIPELATGWTVSPDAQSYTFTLRSDAFWTDGNPVTAYDVAYGIERTLNPDTGADYGRSLLDPIALVTPLDATHVRFDLKQPTAYFPSLMALAPARPQPQWAIELHGDAWTRPENIVSNGPYELVAWEAAPRVRVEKIADGPPAAGNNLAFHIQYWNDGGAAADNVIISDSLLSGMTYLADTSVFPVTGTGAPGDPLVWDAGTLPPFSFGEFELFVAVTAVQEETISNTVNITTTTLNDQSLPNERQMTWSDLVGPNDTHLNVNKWLQNPFIAPGANLTYVLDVCNGFPQGSSASAPVVITDTLHPSLTLQSWWSGGNFWYDDSGSIGQDLVLKRPSVPGYWCDKINVNVQVDVNAPSGLSIDNTVIVTSSSDLESGDNTASWVENVVSATDLVLTIGADPDPVVQNQPLTYTVTVSNAGPVTATNVILTDTLPAIASVFSIPGNCTETGSDIVCALAEIPPAGSAFINIVVTPTAAGEALNFAQVDALEHDTDPVNNAFSLSTVVLPASNEPVITAVAPGYGFNDQATTVDINGYNFQSGAVVTLGVTSLAPVTFISDTMLRVDVPPGLPAGTFDIWVENPDGKMGVLLSGYTVLENQPPTVTAVTPSQGPNDIPVVVDIFGANFTGESTASLLPDFIPLEGLVFIDSTHLRAVVPQLIAAKTYTVEVFNPDESSNILPNAYEAIDPTLNTDLYAASFDLWRSPLSIRMGDVVTPQIGLNVHRQGGLAALPNVAVDFYLHSPSGDLIGQSQALSLEANSVRSTIPLVWSPPNPGEFLLYAVIDPANTVIEVNEGNNIVSRTITVLPPLPGDVTPPVIADFTINDGATAVSQRQVTLDMTAADAGSGVANVLYVEYEYVPSAGGWVPVQMSDWLPYAESHVDYPWALLPSPGVHYLQAWAADAAGNVSAPFSRFISYQPNVIDISAGQVHVYRDLLTTGEELQVRLTVLDGGTVDFYVWNPDNSLVQTHEGVTSFQEIVFTASQDGVHQIEVEAQTNAQYQLEIIRSGPAGESLSAPTGLARPLRSRSTPFMAPGDEPGDDAGLPSAPSSDTSIMLPLILRN